MNLWLCTCGIRNLRSADACVHCGRPRPDARRAGGLASGRPTAAHTAPEPVAPARKADASPKATPAASKTAPARPKIAPTRPNGAPRPAARRSWLQRYLVPVVLGQVALIGILVGVLLGRIRENTTALAPPAPAPAAVPGSYPAAPPPSLAEPPSATPAATPIPPIQVPEATSPPVQPAPGSAMPPTPPPPQAPTSVVWTPEAGTTPATHQQSRAAVDQFLQWLRSTEDQRQRIRFDYLERLRAAVLAVRGQPGHIRTRSLAPWSQSYRDFRTRIREARPGIPSECVRLHGAFSRILSAESAFVQSLADGSHSGRIDRVQWDIVQANQELEQLLRAGHPTAAFRIGSSGLETLPRQ